MNSLVERNNFEKIILNMWENDDDDLFKFENYDDPLTNYSDLDNDEVS